jgi:hypothetical protein
MKPWPPCDSVEGAAPSAPLGGDGAPPSKDFIGAALIKQRYPRPLSLGALGCGWFCFVQIEESPQKAHEAQNDPAFLRFLRLLWPISCGFGQLNKTGWDGPLFGGDDF